MPFRVSGKNLDLGDALRGRINDRIAETVGKYFDGGYSGHVTLAKDGSVFALNAPSISIRRLRCTPTGRAADAYASADQAALRIEKRLRRYHRRLKDHRVERGDGTSIDAASYIIAAPEEGNDVDIDAFTPVVIAESTTTLKRLSVSDAVTELDMTGVPVLVFRHAAHGGINIVYRRADGHFGWIDPPPPAAADAH